MYHNSRTRCTMSGHPRSPTATLARSPITEFGWEELRLGGSCRLLGRRPISLGRDCAIKQPPSPNPERLAKPVANALASHLQPPMNHEPNHPGQPAPPTSKNLSESARPPTAQRHLPGHPCLYHTATTTSNKNASPTKKTQKFRRGLRPRTPACFLLILKVKIEQVPREKFVDCLSVSVWKISKIFSKMD